MRFDSIANLVEFLGVLSIQGYSVPFKDYDKDMKNKGLIKHIHNYKAKLETINPRKLKLSFDNGKNCTYDIILERHDIYSEDEIEEMYSINKR